MESSQSCYSIDICEKGGHFTVQLACKQQPVSIALGKHKPEQSPLHKPRPILQHTKIIKDFVQ